MIPQPLPANSTEMVIGMCLHAGIDHEPGGFTLGQVVALLRACEYDVDADYLLWLVKRGRVVPLDGDRWLDAHVHQATAHAEASRRWAVGSTLHRLKKSAARLAVEEHGDEQLRLDVAERPLKELLLLLTATDSRGLREALLEATLTKCSVAEIDIEN